MSKNHAAAARRAKRKHEKEQKRKKRLSPKPLGVSTRPAVPASAPPIRWQPETQGIEGLAAAARVPFYEAARLADGLARAHGASHPLRDAVWTRDRVCALETSALVDRLEQLGIRVDHDRFIAETPRFGSAVRWARETWLPLAPAHADVHARDFIALAACELWKRWRPGSPSQEGLHELLLLGEDHADRQDDMAATEHWIRFWESLRPLLTPELRTTGAAGELLGVDASVLFNWGSDFSMAATYAAGQDAALGRRAAEVQGEILTQFSAEADSWRLPLACDRAEVLYVTGERIEAERILREQMEAHATSAGAYVRLAELWAPYGSEDREAIIRALDLLAQAIARPVKDAADWDLAVRVKQLRKQLKACGGDAGKAVTV
ncbi:hypothetical protein [Sorangium sp. So ce1151]|uniref:hypothetical protein n=1 Tax=Sorangium sp. So ce1151 TaxID=3133332 RepID=UPI003F61271D